jgi:predicted dehydrogenase
VKDNQSPSISGRVGDIRWGIAGLGNVVTGRFAPALAHSRRSMLSACSTRDPEAAKPFAKKYAVPRVYGSFEQLAADDAVDVVYLATPNSLHYPQARRALLAGKHVLCEKPLALTVEHGIELAELARQRERLLKVAYQFRFEGVFGHVRNYILSGRLGELRMVRLFGCAAAAARASGWRQDPAEGGILSDLAVHFLDLVPWITGLEFTDISARANPPDIASASPQTISILGTLGRNCHCFISASREAPHGQNSFAVEGSLGTVFSTAWRGVQECELDLVDASGCKIEKIPQSAIFDREIEAFEDELGGHSTNLASGVDGIRAIMLADAVRQSAQTKQAIELSPVHGDSHLRDGL